MTGVEIKEIIERKGLNQKDVAVQMGTSPAHLCHSLKKEEVPAMLAKRIEAAVDELSMKKLYGANSAAKPKEKEIWSYRVTRTDAYDREVLILKVLDGVAAGYELLDNRTQCNLVLRSKTEKNLNASRLVYVFFSNFGDYVRTITDDEFDAVRDTTAQVLGLEKTVEVTKEVEVVKEVVKEVPVKEDHNYDYLSMALLRKERDLYKEFFERMVGKYAR